MGIARVRFGVRGLVLSASSARTLPTLSHRLRLGTQMGSADKSATYSISSSLGHC